MNYATQISKGYREILFGIPATTNQQRNESKMVTGKFCQKNDVVLKTNHFKSDVFF